MAKVNKVWTPNGYQEGPINSLVGKGESIIDYTNGTGTLVTKGKVGVDNQPSSVHEDDSNVIAGNDRDWTNGIKFSEQIAPLTAKLQMYNNIEKKMGKKSDMSSLSRQTMQLQKSQIDRAKAPILQAMKRITDRQQAQHEAENYNCGKDRFDSGKGMWGSIKDAFNNWTRGGKGKVSNATLDFGYTVPALLEGTMLNRWNRERPQIPDIYAANRYAPMALRTMAANRVSPYPMLEKLNTKDRQAAYQIANSGGYTGGQRQNARVALALGSQRNAADAIMNAQEKNAAYRNAYAEMASRLGDSEAARQQQANQYGWDAYNRAHGARIKGIETHLSNLGLLGQKWLQQRIKNKQYGDVLDMYQQDIDNKRDAIKALYGGKTTPADNNATSNTKGATVASKRLPDADFTGLGKYKPSIPSLDEINRMRIPSQSVGISNSGYTQEDIDRAVQSAIDTRNWAKDQELRLKEKFGTPEEHANLLNIYTKGIIPNEQFIPIWPKMPIWAGRGTDYDPYYINFLIQNNDRNVRRTSSGAYN